MKNCVGKFIRYFLRCINWAAIFKPTEVAGALHNLKNLGTFIGVIFMLTSKAEIVTASHLIADDLSGTAAARDRVVYLLSTDEKLLHTEVVARPAVGQGLLFLTGSNISLDNVEAFKIGASSSLMGAGVSATAPAATAKRAAPTAASPVLLSAAGVATLAATASSGGDPRADLRFSPQ